jgi:stage II sporulation protein D
VVCILLFSLFAAAAPPEDFRRLVEAEPGAFALLGDLAAGRVVMAGDARVLQSPVPAGSWVKLFHAYALVAAHQVSPEVKIRCDGWQGPGPRCWYGPGHGELDLEAVLAHSCNAYFAAMRPRLEKAGYAAALAAFLPEASGRPANPAGAAAWDGAYVRGELTPRSPRFDALCRAVGALVLARRLDWAGTGDSRALADEPVKLDETARAVVLAGMRRAASEGTAVELARAFGSDDLLAKTSSMMPAAAPARSRNRNRVGMVCAFYPAEAPRAFIFLFVPRGFAPEKAAPLAGRVLRSFCLQRNIFTTEAQITQGQPQKIVIGY